MNVSEIADPIWTGCMARLLFAILRIICSVFVWLPPLSCQIFEVTR